MTVVKLTLNRNRYLNNKEKIMYCRQCGNAMKDYNQDVHDAAHRMYRDWQRSRKQGDKSTIRNIAREVCREVLLDKERKRENRISTCRAGVPWTSSEDYILKKEYSIFVGKTAVEHRRSHNAIATRLQKLLLSSK